MKKEELKNYDPIIEDNIEIGNGEIIVRPTKNDGEQTDIELLFDWNHNGLNTFQDSDLFSDELKKYVEIEIESFIEKHY